MTKCVVQRVEGLELGRLVGRWRQPVTVRRRAGLRAAARARSISERPEAVDLRRGVVEQEGAFGR